MKCNNVSYLEPVFVLVYICDTSGKLITSIRERDILSNKINVDKGYL